MKVLKKILFPIFSLFLIYQSLELVKLLLATKPSEYSVTIDLILAFLLSLFVTGVFAFLGFAYKTNKVLPESYYFIKWPQKLNAVYRILGVHYFRVLLLLTFWGTKKNRKKYFNGTKSGIENFIFQSKQSEIGHLAALVSLLIISVVLLMQQYYLLVVFICIINLIGNFYPIVLQRQHRIRIQKLVHSFENHDTSSNSKA